jgi:hypothetical protein
MFAYFAIMEQGKRCYISYIWYMTRLHLLITTFICSLPLLLLSNQGFEKNEGQFTTPEGIENENVLYCYENGRFKVSLRPDGFSYEILSLLDSNQLDGLNDLYENTKFDIHHERVDFKFPKVPTSIETYEELKADRYYYAEQEVIKSKSYKKIIYYDVMQGIDIEFIVSENKFKYNIIKNKGANLLDFYLSVEMDGELKSDAQGLLFSLENENIIERIPLSYIQSSNQQVEVNYSIENNRISYSCENVDINETLIIDPEPDLVWSTFFGGNQYDLITDSYVAEGDTLYTVGITMSTNNISTSGAHQTTYQGDLDVSISKFQMNGDLIWSTYYAGPQSERCYAIHVDENNEVYVAGSTFSNIGFATGGAQQWNVDGGDDIFIVKMSSNGVREWGTYHGGNAHDFVTDMHVENDTIYLVGHTTSTNNIGTTGAHQESFTANEAGHITLFNTSGQLLWGTYFGNIQNNSVEGLGVSSNRIFITGRTNGTTGISTTGAHQETLAGFTNAFLSSFSKSGDQLWGTYFGGQYTDVATDIDLDTSGGIFITGNASSLNNISTPGAYQETRLSSEQAFIAHFDNYGSRIWGSYVGGTGSDYVNIVCTDDKGFLYIGGNTNSSENIASPDTYQTSNNGSYDAFVQKFSFEGNFEWGTYLGGIGNEDLFSLSLSDSYNIIATGSTNQNDTIFGAGNSLNNQYSGGTLDGFIAYICQENQPSITYENGQLVASHADSYEWYLEGVPMNIDAPVIDPNSDGVYTVQTSSFGKCPSESDPFIYSSVSLKEAENELVSIYPNPTKSEINVKTITNSNITITDLSGRILYHLQAVKQVKINVSDFQSGIYIVSVENENKIVQKSVIKM